jgi:hypothetical protein
MAGGNGSSGCSLPKIITLEEFHRAAVGHRPWTLLWPLRSWTPLRRGLFHEGSIGGVVRWPTSQAVAEEEGGAVGRGRCAERGIGGAASGGRRGRRADRNILVARDLQGNCDTAAAATARSGER